MHREQARWEYHRVDHDSAQGLDFNALGADGWELVSAANDVIFKRPLPGFRERVTLDQKRAVYERSGLPWPPANQRGEGE